MDGKMLIRTILDVLDKQTIDSVLGTDNRLLYSYLDAAVIEYVRETRCLTSSVSLTVIAGQQAYDLPPDFIGLTMKNKKDRYFIRYFDGVDYSFPTQTFYEDIFLTNETDSAEVIDNFCIIDRQTTQTILAGAATSAGVKSNGQCILTDSGKLFTTTNLVYPRDTVHNEDDASDGIILSVTDPTHLVTALFNGGDNEWGSGDDYVIQRTITNQIYLDAPPSTAGHIITVPYLVMPAPVYSDYGFWRFSNNVCRAICCEAAFMYQNSKGEYTGSDRHHGLFEQELTRSNREKARSILQGGRYKNPY